MNTQNIVRGNKLMLFYNGKSLAFATSHTLSISANTVDISTKDHGVWSASDVGNMSWELSSENLYTEVDYDKLFEAMLNKTPIDVVFGIPTDYDVNGLGTSKENWTAPTKGCYTGKAVITSLSVNANVGENATYSCTFSGYGAITKIADGDTD